MVEKKYIMGTLLLSIILLGLAVAEEEFVLSLRPNLNLVSIPLVDAEIVNVSGQCGIGQLDKTWNNHVGFGFLTLTDTCEEENECTSGFWGSENLTKCCFYKNMGVNEYPFEMIKYSALLDGEEKLEAGKGYFVRNWGESSCKIKFRGEPLLIDVDNSFEVKSYQGLSIIGTPFVENYGSVQLDSILGNCHDTMHDNLYTLDDLTGNLEYKRVNDKLMNAGFGYILYNDADCELGADNPLQQEGTCELNRELSEINVWPGVSTPGSADLKTMDSIYVTYKIKDIDSVDKITCGMKHSDGTSYDKDVYGDGIETPDHFRIEVDENETYISVNFNFPRAFEDQVLEFEPNNIYYTGCYINDNTECNLEVAVAIPLDGKFVSLCREIDVFSNTQAWIETDRASYIVEEEPIALTYNVKGLGPEAQGHNISITCTGTINGRQTGRRTEIATAYECGENEYCANVTFDVEPVNHTGVYKVYCGTSIGSIRICLPASTYVIIAEENPRDQLAPQLTHISVSGNTGVIRANVKDTHSGVMKIPVIGDAFDSYIAVSLKKVGAGSCVEKMECDNNCDYPGATCNCELQLERQINAGYGYHNYEYQLHSVDKAGNIVISGPYSFSFYGYPWRCRTV